MIQEKIEEAEFEHQEMMSSRSESIKGQKKKVKQQIKTLSKGQSYFSEESSNIKDDSRS